MTRFLSSICLAALCASPGWAQDMGNPPASDGQQAAAAAADAGATAQDDGGIADIVVTAQRREEAMQDVPIAIAAFGREQLQSAQVRDTLDLKSVTPGLVITTAAAGFAAPRIRGVGTSATGPGIESPVAVYVDGVYFASANSTLFSLNDVEQIAVLKGPQGTLFGRNATGGLIQITTRKPTDTPTLDAHVKVGNLETVGGDVYLAGPLAPNLSASIAGVYDYQGEGFGKNLANGRDVQTHRNYAGRAKLHWDGGDTRVTLSGDYSKATGSDPALRSLGRRSNGTFSPGGPRDIQADLQPEFSIESYGGSLTARHDFGGVEMMSVTAYRKTDFNPVFDLDQTTTPLRFLDLNQGDKQFSQELQLQSVGASALQWTVGGMYFWSRAAYDPSTTIFPLGNAFVTPPFPPGGFSRTDSTLRLNSLAAYGQATYALSDATNLTLGLRYTTDKRTINANKTRSVAFAPFVVPIPGQLVDDSKRFSKVTWRASVDHRFSPELMVFASYNRGFKSGTFEPSGVNPARPGNGNLVLPETLDAFEAGFKSDLFDRRVRLNVSGYYYDYKNSQVVIIRSGFVQLYNGEGAETYGVDADTSIRVTRDFTVNLGASWMHARYKGFTNAVRTTPLPGGGSSVGLPGSADATGNRLQNTPDLTFSASATYTIPTSFGDIMLAGSYYYNDGYFTEPENRLRQPHYELVDASITWTHPSKNFDLRFWGKNLTDEVYASQLLATDAGDTRGAAPGRTYGVTAGFKF